MKRTKVTFQQEKLTVSTELMRALAHPLRLKILEYLDQNKNIQVNQIYNTLKIEQSIASQHLRILKNAGVLVADKDGKYMHYTIDYHRVSNAVKAINRFMGKA
ncbi:MAG TPA: metalloregulator ArsR/SmtB family transcription factor [Saprospiraceae bacterium]|jgi:ArsR family transcriptional regulator|nr:metalloregulator ArsR/SmtB family transcription factor [Saprospiraceae bacterium]HZV45043.1 metalloregulator ArsR/SmtB family transcription factor [Saprospiraceae bacterium]